MDSPLKRGGERNHYPPSLKGKWLGVRSRITYFMQLRTAINRNAHFSKTHPPMLPFVHTGGFTKHIYGNTHTALNLPLLWTSAFKNLLVIIE